MTNQPNIIFLFSDQQRWDTLGCYGQTLPITPNLDAMAKEGVQFQYTFTCQPVCGPARACLQTGLYATQLGCFRNGVALPLGQQTIAKLLSANGYSVGYVGKWHLASTHGAADIDIGAPIDCVRNPVPLERRGGYKDYWIATDALEHTSHSYDGYMYDANGNKVFFPEGRYRVDAVTDYVIDILKKCDKTKPFFLFVSYIEPHHQNDHNRYEGPHGSKERFKDYQIPADLVDTKGDWRDNFPDYLGCCNSLDENVGRIRKTIEELGIKTDTVVIYTSDHGSHFRTRNAEYKRSCHDNCIRIPLVIYGNGFKGNKKITELISILDLPPTILDIAGVPIPPYMQGKSLIPLVHGTTEQWRDVLFLQISESQVGRAIRTKKWKYSIVAPGKDGGRYSKSNLYVEDYLYDLDADPHEKINLVADPNYAQTRTELIKILIREMQKAGEQVPLILPQSRMPKTNLFYITYPLKIDSENEVTMTVQMSVDSPPMDIPLCEMLEEIMDIPLIINIDKQKFFGTLETRNQQVFLIDSKGDSKRFSPLVAKWVGKTISFVMILPSSDESNQIANFNPKYELLILI